ncbi:MAG: Na+:solute symporter [Candidatus Marinimicrobia bacterium]|jgi:Na+/proline symporter|nr:Na+:solute symporter [Candidatus Neomarinimicrobiota bacterium]MDP6593242.1 Na+:solute symporter [Candidatus Neomarinimicrobiota bacterium]|tara:strand:- start:304 stop:2175 length:1872 start_codon:yes stop_codon:yes gene_type:complete
MIDLAIVLAFVIYSVSAGFRARSKASRNLVEYFLAGRSIPGWKAGFSMAATQYAADTPLLVMGLMATGGIFMLWRLWIYALAFLLMGFVLGRAWRRSMILTDAEFTEVRYSGKGVLALRGLKAVYYGTVINCTVMAMVLVAAIRISETFLLWHEWLPAGVYDIILGWVQAVGVELSSGVTGLETWIATANNILSIVTILAFVALYSTTGGLRSVVATDIVQFSVAMIATFIYAVIAVTKAGGLGGMIDKMVLLYGEVRTSEMLSFSPNSWDAVLPFLVLIGLQWFFQMNSDGTGYLAQRTMACRTDTGARFAGFVFTVAQVLVRSLFWLPIGVALLVLYPYDPAAASGEAFVASREILFATGIKDLLPVGIRGLMLTGLLAALASTIDTHLTWGASYWSNDIYKRIVNEAWLKRQPSSKELVLIARLSNILILAIALTIMANLGSIQTAWYISLLFGAGMGSVLVLRWLWERINLYSEVAAIATSLIVAPIILFSVNDEWLRLLLMSVSSTVAVLVVTVLTPETDESILDEFYRRITPPGLWRKTAARLGFDAGQPGQAFRDGAYLVITVAATIFLLLVGVGKLMLPGPGSSSLSAWFMVLLGLAAISLWWKKVLLVQKEAAQ